MDAGYTQWWGLNLRADMKWLLLYLINNPCLFINTAMFLYSISHPNICFIDGTILPKKSRAGQSMN